MTVASATGPQGGPLPTLADTGPTRPRGKLRRRLLFGIALVVALGIGVGIGAASGSNTSALNAANGQVSALKGQVASLMGQVSSLTGQVSSLSGQVASADLVPSVASRPETVKRITLN